MSTYEFQSMLFRSAPEVAQAIAEAWMWGDGQNSKSDIAEFLRDCADSQLADEVITAWELEEETEADIDDNGEPVMETWLASRDLDRDAIVKAFADFRASFSAE